MEDWKLLSADCVVLSCCCQCLILQILVLILLKFPYELARKATRYIKKKIANRRRRRKMIRKEEESVFVFVRSQTDSFERFSVERCNGCGCCIDDVEKVFDEMSDTGVFAFGSFWGGEESESFAIPTAVAKQELEYDVGRYKLGRNGY